MSMLSRVKIRLLCAALSLVVLPSAPAAEDTPDAREILKAVRVAQSDQDWKFRGHLEMGKTKVPFRLIISKGVLRYEFTDTGDTLTLRLGEKDSRLEETKGGKTEKVGAAKFDDLVRGTDLTYEDLAMRFLYWPDAKVVGNDTIMASESWKMEIHPPAGAGTQFSKVNVWIAKEHGGLMKAENYDAQGRLSRRFIVRNVMKRDGAWFLKTMRIEAIPPGKNSDPTPTYLEIDDIEK